MFDSTVSVIVPCYKGENFIGSCLQMLFGQTYKALEIIVIIDGVYDRSEEIAKEYPVKIIKFETNKGLSAGRNAGIDAATGKYIHFLDIDDKINSDFYKNLVEAIEETGSDIACSSMYNEPRDYQCQIFNKRKVAVSTKEKLKLTWVSKWGYVWRYLFRLDFLKNTGVRFEEGRLMEDLLFSFQTLYYASKIVGVPGAIYFYAKTPGSILHRPDKEAAKKRSTDSRHAVRQIETFAKSKRISLPGRSIDFDKAHYIIRKYWTKLFKKQCNLKHIERYGLGLPNS